MLYQGLRVDDVSDGMNMLGLMAVGLVVPAIAPLWKDIGNFSHQFWESRLLPNRQQSPKDTTIAVGSSAHPFTSRTIC